MVILVAWKIAGQ